MDPVLAAVHDAIAVFGDVHGFSGLPGLRVARQGRTVAVQVAGQQIQGRLSAHSLLAGRVFGAALAPVPAQPFSLWLPGTDPQDWDRSARAEPGRVWEREDRLAGTLLEAGLAFLAEGEREEARLCLRRSQSGSPAEPRRTEPRLGPEAEPAALLQAAVSWRDSVARRIPPDLLRDATRPTLAEEVAGRRSRWGLEGAIRAVVLPHAGHHDPVERGGAAAALGSICEEIAASDPVRVDRLAGGTLSALLADAEPWVREPALDAAVILAHRLLRRRAWARAAPLIDQVLAEGVARRELLAWRFECRLAAGDSEGAEAAWEEVQALRGLPPHRAIEVQPGRYDRDPSWREFRGAAERRAREPLPAPRPRPRRSG